VNLTTTLVGQPVKGVPSALASLTRGGLDAVTRSLAIEYADKGIRVNAVAPGVVWTPRVSAFLGDEGEQRNIVNTPLRRVAQPADIAAALLFLASDLAGYVTGIGLNVSGGIELFTF